MLLGEEGGEAEVSGGGAEGMGKPPGEPGGKVGYAGVRSGRIVLYRRIIVRKGTFGTCAWPRHRRGLDNDRRLVGAVLEVLGYVGGIDVLGLPAAGRIPEYRAATAGLLVFWRLGNDWARGRGAGSGTAGGVDHRLGAVAVGLGEEFGELGTMAGACRRRRRGRCARWFGRHRRRRRWQEESCVRALPARRD